MKTFLPAFIIATLMVACSSNPYELKQQQTSNPAAVTIVDTTGLSEFQQWKSDKLNSSSDEKQVITKAVSRKKSTAARPAAKKQPVVYQTRTSESQNAAKTAEKKGWSKAAKGAVIGAGTGAVAGAVIHKRNRVVGGVVGGVIGAGAGYGIGRHMDKKDGRY